MRCRERAGVSSPSVAYSPGQRFGAALLEAIVAVAVLSLTGMSVMTLALQASAAVNDSSRSEREMRAASAFMDAVALWSREDLDRRLGDHQQGSWRLRIVHTEPPLYAVALTDSTRRFVVLQTALFRPEATNAALR